MLIHGAVLLPAFLLLLSVVIVSMPQMLPIDRVVNNLQYSLKAKTRRTFYCLEIHYCLKSVSVYFFIFLKKVSYAYGCIYLTKIQ